MCGISTFWLSTCPVGSNRVARDAEFDAALYVVKAAELVAGAANLTLLGLHSEMA